MNFQVHGSALYKPGTRWNADKNIDDARQATLDANLNGVDVVSWWCDWGGGSIVGTAFIGGLCGSYNTNLNEFQLRHSAAGMVNLKNLAYLLYKFILISWEVI